MARKFISMLGTSNYRSCVYSNGNEKVETRFIQKALTDIYMKDIKPEDKIVIFLTKLAREKNWEDSESSLDGIKSFFEKNNPERLEEARKVFGNDEKWENIKQKNIGLKNILKETYPEENILDISINDGKSEEEIWSIFEEIYKCIDEGDEVIFDITHGFRSLPMQALTVLNYARVMKNIKLLGIYYGAFEVPGNEKPIFNLTSYSDILNWTDAVNTFIKYGNSNAIRDIFNEKVKDGNREIKVLEKFIEELSDLTNCIDTSRGRIVEKSECKNNKKRMKKSIYAAASGAKEELKNIDEEKEALIIPLKPLFKKIGDNITPFCKENNFEVGMATIRWCIKNNLIQNAYTALDETIKTYVCDKYNLSNTSEETRDKIVKKSLTHISKNIEKNSRKEIKENPRNITDKDIKEFINKKDDKEELTESEKEKVKIIKNIIKTVPISIVKVSDTVSKHRNDMNHFGFSSPKNTAQYSNLNSEIKNLFKTFEDIIEENKDKNFIE